MFLKVHSFFSFLLTNVKSKGRIALALTLAFGCLLTACGDRQQNVHRTVSFPETDKDLLSDIFFIESEKEGPVVFLLAGIHGDEEAGYLAAEELKSLPIKKGKFYILSPVNRIGSERKVREFAGQDLNRLFPGKKTGTEAEQAAWLIFQKIKEIHPDLVIDLHEAEMSEGTEDFLGNSIIFSSLNGMDDFVLDLIAESGKEKNGLPKLNFFQPAVKGSINQAVSDLLDVPILTIEGEQSIDLETRICFQKEVTGYVLERLGMIDSQEGVGKK